MVFQFTYNQILISQQPRIELWMPAGDSDHAIDAGEMDEFNSNDDTDFDSSGTFLEIPSEYNFHKQSTTQN